MCPKCDTFTMKDKCNACGTTSGTVRPPKYSPDDKYAEMKRKAKEEDYKEKGLLQ